MDVMFHVKLRTMMESGGSEEEDLVVAVKVDSLSLAEGTWTCQDARQAGQVVLCWDNSYSLLRSKTIAYRTWVVKPQHHPQPAPAAATTSGGGGAARDGVDAAAEQAEAEAAALRALDPEARQAAEREKDHKAFEEDTKKMVAKQRTSAFLDFCTRYEDYM